MEKREEFKKKAIKKINDIMPEIFELYRNNGKALKADLDDLVERTMQEYGKIVKETEGTAEGK